MKLFFPTVAAGARSVSSGGPRAAQGQTALTYMIPSTRTWTRTNSPVDLETYRCRKSKIQSMHFFPLTFDVLAAPLRPACSDLVPSGRFLLVNLHASIFNLHFDDPPLLQEYKGGVIM